MAEIVCTKFEIPNPLAGNVEREVLLWENPDPTTNFNSTTRSFLTPLSSNLVPIYKKLKIVYKRTATGSAIYETVIDMPEILTNFVKDANKASFVFGFETADYYSGRYLQIVSDTQWWVSTGYRSNNTSGISTHNVITHIYGIEILNSNIGLVTIGNVNNITSPYYMEVPIPEDVTDGVVIINYTRDSNQPFDSVSCTSGTAVLEDGTAGKYQYTSAYLNTYAIRIKNVSAGSTVTVMRSSNGANFYTYVVYKFS